MSFYQTTEPDPDPYGAPEPETCPSCRVRAEEPCESFCTCYDCVRKEQLAAAAEE